ncbi:glutamine synthetase family protein [Streptomyces hiroshimensis]|uniref:Glutamine synthetase n=1 Tax=Streptomyces hiroshimensis TaxID=66424 RepID=A0ABQ2Z5H2_9ACTN|nr:glutamine synthetase family protein [Streptomyces hiroshimensis]GGY01959.1 glutamine synthetase [Streptomyces hiroshimensis]
MDTPPHEAAASAARQEAARLTAKDIHGVALTWVDNAGIARVKAVPTARLAHAAQWGVGMSPVFDVYLSDDSAVTSAHIGGPDGDLRLFPDLGRLTVLAAQPGWAWAPADRCEQDGAPYAACQRGFARRMAGHAAQSGLELRMGYETEWVVTHAAEEDGAAEAPGRTRRYAGPGPAYGMTRVTALSGYVRDVLEALAAQGIDVLQIHPEYSPGQFEVSTAPAGPVAAADDAVLVRETIRAVSAHHGLHATFAPVVEHGAVGNGAHLHLSLWREGSNLCRGGEGPFGMTRIGEAFLAGVLQALPALLAVTCPHPAGYLRLSPSMWAGVFQCWGPENREAALRFIPGPAKDLQGANAEIKCIDATANPYLVAGAVIAAGLDGIDRRCTLPDPVSGDPAVTHAGVPRLPTSLPQALEHFRGSALLREAFGDPLYEAFLAVREGEYARLQHHTPEALVEDLRHRF